MPPFTPPPHYIIMVRGLLNVEEVCQPFSMLFILTPSSLLQARRGENVKVPVMDAGVPMQLVGGALKKRPGRFGIRT